MLLAAIGSFLALTATPSLAVTTLLFMLCFAALGAGNGALFQLVPLRWPTNTAVAGSMIGEVGALGGANPAQRHGFLEAIYRRLRHGFVSYALFTGLVLGCLFLWQRKWVGAWVGPRGKVLDPASETLGEAEAGASPQQPPEPNSNMSRIGSPRGSLSVRGERIRRSHVGGCDGIRTGSQSPSRVTVCEGEQIHARRAGPQENPRRGIPGGAGG